MATVHELLTYWFGPLTTDGTTAEDRSDLWWGGHPDTDAQVRTRFLLDLEGAATGDRGSWAETPPGRLALVLCLDQLPRMIHRGTPRAFAFDGMARNLTREGIRRGHDRHLAPIERVFFYLPLEHAEDLVDQESSVALFEQLAAEVPDTLREEFTTYVDFARRHREVIARFGRFPHRNAILGRPSRAEELAFLATPGSSF